MKRSIQKGFTLVELMIVVAIIGIMAAVALPQYQTYTIKAKVTQLISSLDSIKSCVNDQYINAPTNMSVISTLCSVAANAYFASLQPAGTGLTFTAIAASLGATISGSLTNNLAIASTDGSNLTWVCNGTDSKYFPAGCRG